MSGLGSRSQKPGNAKSTVGSDEREPGPQKIWDRKSRRVSGSLENGTRRERNPKGAESEGSGTRRERNPKGVEPEGSGTRYTQQISEKFSLSAINRSISQDYNKRTC
jgi:hypothetical protein